MDDYKVDVFIKLEWRGQAESTDDAKKKACVLGASKVVYENITAYTVYGSGVTEPTEEEKCSILVKTPLVKDESELAAAALT